MESKRLSSVGISFLKLCLSNTAFNYFPAYNEGQLTIKYSRDIRTLREKLKSHSECGRQSSYAAVGSMVVENGPKTTFTFEKEFMTTLVDVIFDTFKTEHPQVDLIYQEKKFEKLEEKIGYTFQNRALFLQSFTNGSHELAKINGTYQRLEFLGDAILDYLIVFYLYNHPSKLNLGEIAQYRDKFISNDTFALLSTEHGFKTYFLHRSKIEGQRVYADIFEALAGAVYIDSGMDLDIVWKIFYKLMKEEPSFNELDSKIEGK